MEQLQAFLSEHVSTFEELELLVFLRRHAAEAWAAHSAAERVGLGPEGITQALEGLTAKGLVQCRGGAFQYRDSTREVEASVDRLLCAYDEHRGALLGLIAKNAIVRARARLQRKTG